MMLQLPEAYLKRMEKMLGEEEFGEYLSSFSAPVHTGLRLNPLKVPWEPDETGSLFCHPADRDNREPVQAAGHMAAFGLRPVPWAQPYGFYYREDNDPVRPGKSPLHEAGLYYIQEPSAMAVAALSGTKPGEKILDLCAAPGGKSTQLAGMLNGKGLLVSNEVNPERAAILSQNIERMGVRNAIVTCGDSGKLAERFGAFFDRVIVDAPCSGEGMFRKEPQALAMWSQANVERCAQRQREILDHAAEMVKSGGILVYSTCTFAQEEDEENVTAFLARHPEFSPAGEEAFPDREAMKSWGLVPGGVPGSIRLWPHRLEGEGHFLAVLQKRGEWSVEKVPEGRGFAAAGKRNGLPLQAGTALADFLRDELREEIGPALARDAGSSVFLFGRDLCLIPYGEQISLAGLSVLRPGLVIGSMRKDRFEPAHSLAMALRPSGVLRVLNLDAGCREASAWLHGETVSCDPALRGWTLVTIDGVSAGWGKASGGMLKNHYPKGLRRPYV